MKTKIGTFFEEKDMKTYVVEEGTATYSVGVDPNNGLPNEQITFAAQVNEESFLTYGTGERALKLAGADGNVATHFNPYAPEVDKKLPKATTASYTPRFVGAYKLKAEEILLPLSPSNSAITTGDNITIDPATGKLDKATAKTTATGAARSWDTIPANTGGYILVQCIGGSIIVETKGG